MRLVSYRKKESGSKFRMGYITENEQIVDIHLTSQKAFQAGNTTVELPYQPELFYQEGQFFIDEATKLVGKIKDSEFTFSMNDIQLGMPLGTAKKVICVGKNYADHVAEMKSDIPEFPVLFAKFDNAIIGPEDEIHFSSATEKLDYEVELTIVIGKEASHVHEENALDYVAGYTIGNDTSARDLQKRTPQWLQGKSLDHTTPIGPWIVTKNEILDPGNLTIASYVNNEKRQYSNTKHLIFSVPYLVSFISNLITLKPGDIIMTGTPDGVGFAMNPPGYVKDRDKIKLVIEGIGVMENVVKKVL
ncbi:fumarylacetoacetate hydrolase family protein [Oceanobacillus kimchii]|uniref:fumarylacetoacetate hydrolase family protein n=1 Tax=Oceanobacillus kimchii TaxID=746691 RepID=UPI000349726B|nr:fumarylacetoacetate hydrolase family protein [Oceanobacillus kimchii]MCT1577918.1 fumarylacetoacetate hydrolase family protein [Oceanobacillus kimchii]MCT2137478.1 fumarylacetoacetate hydrolase family protein [Oceanobacillus kimchii]